MREPIDNLYIHIPFCPTKCSYCAFETHIGSMKLAPAYLEAIELEITRLPRDRATVQLQSIYFGGGTPSMLEPSDIARVLDHIQSILGIQSAAEITLECHPATVNKWKLHGFRDAGITRVSFGGESLNPAELAAIGRGHGPDLVLSCVEISRSIGFESVALDLIYGLPGQSIGTWDDGLSHVLQAGVDHLSLYPLSIEPRTVFARRTREGSLSLPPDEDVIRMYRHACDVLADGELEHYEIANWARPGSRCKHNLAYWRNREFFGVGVGAHGYIKPFRTENLPGTSRYIRRVLGGSSPVIHREPIDETIERAEAIILGLRLLADGIDMQEMSTRFSLDFQATYATELDELQRLELVTVEGNVARLAEMAVPIANEVWERFVTT